VRGTVTERQIDQRSVEFPRIDDRLLGMPARYGVTMGAGKLVRYDLERGIAEEHSFGTVAEPGGPGEALFAPADSDA
jgi:carotenoid cleavage dioxygenase-like enzyme